MAEIDPNIIIDISKTMSAIDERTRALQNADVQAQIQADHRHKNIMQAMENFVPRREIDSMHSATRAYAEQMAKDARDHCDVNRDAIVSRVERIDATLRGTKRTRQKLLTWILGVLGTALVAGCGFLAQHLPHFQIGWQN